MSTCWAIPHLLEIFLLLFSRMNSLNPACPQRWGTSRLGKGMALLPFSVSHEHIPPFAPKAGWSHSSPCTLQGDCEMASRSLSALVRTLSFLPPELGENCTKTLSLSHHYICVPSSSFFVLSNYSLPPSFSLLLHFLDEDIDTKRS